MARIRLSGWPASAGGAGVRPATVTTICATASSGPERRQHQMPAFVPPGQRDLSIEFERDVADRHRSNSRSSELSDRRATRPSRAARSRPLTASTAVEPPADGPATKAGDSESFQDGAKIVGRTAGQHESVDRQKGELPLSVTRPKTATGKSRFGALRLPIGRAPTAPLIRCVEAIWHWASSYRADCRSGGRALWAAPAGRTDIPATGRIRHQSGSRAAPAVSTPSATTVSPSPWAMPTTARTSAAFFRLCGTPSTNMRSIFSLVIGSCWT